MAASQPALIASVKRLPPHKRFELLTAETLRAFSQDSTVSHDQRILGTSGRRRQIDVVLRSEAPGRPQFVAVECKLYKRPVGIHQVDAMIGQIQDVGAAAGVIVSDSGFDSGARARAKADGRIQLKHLVDSSRTELRSSLTMRLAVRVIELLPGRATFQCIRSPHAGVSSTLDLPDDPATTNGVIRRFLALRGEEVFRAMHAWGNERIDDLPSGENYCVADTPAEGGFGVRVEYRFPKFSQTYIRTDIPVPARGLVDAETFQLTPGEYESTRIS